jgi:hypothetical protein
VGLWILFDFRNSNALEKNASETGPASVFRRGGADTHSVGSLRISKGPNRVGVSFPSPEEETGPVSGTLCSLVIYGCRTMDNVQKASDSDPSPHFLIPVLEAKFHYRTKQQVNIQS